MESVVYYVIGVMSGTSLDGIDLAYIQFKKEEHWNYNIIHKETVAYTSEWKSNLSKAVNFTTNQLTVLNEEYTCLLATVITDFIEGYAISNITAVCSHGHTILHQPEKGITLQIGNLEKLAKLIQQTVICDFRVQDVQMGGQGAPLVPIGDRLLFAEYNYCLNLGGFSNISTELSGKRIAYDICPVNIVLNHYVQQLGLVYDAGGKIAATGVIHAGLLETLNSIDYYQQQFPKSLGLEWVQQNIFPLIDSYHLSIEDILRTFVEHIAMQISSQFAKKGKVLVTGGGAYHIFLINRLRAMSTQQIIVPDAALIEFKEAVIFGFLGVLRMRNENNVLASVTGASKNHSSGVIFHYKKSY